MFRVVYSETGKRTETIGGLADGFVVNQQTAQAIKLLPLEGIPLVKPGDDLPGIILKSANSSKIEWFEGDILVIAQKIVSKAEGRLVNLKQIDLFQVDQTAFSFRNDLLSNNQNVSFKPLYLG